MKCVAKEKGMEEHETQAEHIEYISGHIKGRVQMFKNAMQKPKLDWKMTDIDQGQAMNKPIAPDILTDQEGAMYIQVAKEIESPENKHGEQLTFYGPRNSKSKEKMNARQIYLDTLDNMHLYVAEIQI